MEETILAIKREFSVIDEFNIYNTDSGQFEILESNKCVDMVKSMDQLNCLNEITQINLDSEDTNYFILKGANHLLAVVSLKNKREYNKALFAITVKNLLNTIE